MEVVKESTSVVRDAVIVALTTAAILGTIAAIVIHKLGILKSREREEAKDSKDPF